MKKTVIVCLLLWPLLIISGCWDIRDVSNRAYVTAIGLDAADDGKPGKYKVTFEIVRPLGLKLQSGEPATIVETTEADSIGTAIEQMQSRISRTISLSHLRLLLLGENFARGDFKDPLSYFEKNPGIALRMRLGIVQDVQALDILKSSPLFEKSVSGELVAMDMLEREYSLVRTRRFYDFAGDLRSTNGSGFATRVYRPENSATLVHDGGAVFKDWKLAGWLTAAEAQAANWITGKGKARVTGHTKRGVYTYRVDKHSARLLPVSDNGKLRFIVRVKTYGRVAEEQGEHLDFQDPKNIKKMEKVFSAVIAAQVRGAVHKAQKELGTDYLGFGKSLEQWDPKAYESLNWAEVFPNVPVDVEVKCKVGNFGIAR